MKKMNLAHQINGGEEDQCHGVVLFGGGGVYVCGRSKCSLRINKMTLTYWKRYKN